MSINVENVAITDPIASATHEDYQPIPATDEVVAHVADEAMTTYLETVQDADIVDVSSKGYGLLDYMPQKLVTAAVLSNLLIAPNVEASRDTLASMTLTILSSGYLAQSLYRLKKRNQRLQVSDSVISDYELLNIKNESRTASDIVARWLRPHDTLQQEDGTYKLGHVRDSLVQFADLARDHGIKSINISKSTCDTIDPSLARFAAGTIDTKSWLRRKKHLDSEILDAEGNEIMYEECLFTPQGLRLALTHIGMTTATSESIGDTVDILRKYMSDHPIVKTYDLYRDDPDTLQQKLIKVSKTSLERRLGDVEAERAPMSHGSPTKTKKHLRGAVTGTHVDWQANGLFDKRADLHSALGLDISKIGTILGNDDQYTGPTVIQAVEVATYLMADIAQGSAKTLPDADRSIPIDGFWLASAMMKPFNVLKDPVNISVKQSRLHHLLASGVLLAAMTTVGYGLADRAINEYEAAVVTADAQTAAALHINLYDLTDKQKQTDVALAAARQPIGAAIDRYLKFQAKTLTPESSYGVSTKPGASDPSGIGMVSSPVGNVSSDNPADGVPEWLLNSHGMSTEGKWTTNTGNVLSTYGFWSSAIPEDSVPVDYGDWRHFDPATATQYIKVSRTLPALDQVKGVLVSGTDYTNVIKIPVRNQTVPVLAEVNNEQTNVVELPDGTYEVILSPENSKKNISEVLHLDYYVVPEQNAPGHVPLHNIAPNELQDAQASRKRAQSIVDEARGKLDTDSATADITADQLYIQNKFTYDLSPLDSSIADMVHGSKAQWANFMDTTLQNKRANCNVAATIMAIDNPDLAVAWGYQNNGGNALMNTAAHMYNVDYLGNIYDATPAASSEQVIGAAVQKGIDISFDTRTLVPIGSVLAAGGLAMAYRSRRELRRQLKTVTQTISTGLLVATPTTVLHDAALTTNTTLYGRPTSDLPRSSREFNRQPLKRSELLETLRREDLHTPATQEVLARSAKTADASTRRQLGRAQRVLSILRRAGFAYRVQPGDSDLRNVL